MTTGATLQLLTDVQKDVRGGIRQVWLHRSDARARWAKANKLTMWHRRDAALDRLIKRYQQRGKAVPDGLRQHVHNMRGKHLRKWVVQQERQQRCVTEFFSRNPRTAEQQDNKKRQDVRITAAKLAAPPAVKKMQMALVGQALSGTDDGSAALLAYSRHIPAHTLQARSRTTAKADAGCTKPPATQQRKHNSAPRHLAQMQLTLTHTGLTAIMAPAHATGHKRMRRAEDCATRAPQTTRRTSAGRILLAHSPMPTSRRSSMLLG